MVESSPWVTDELSERVFDILYAIESVSEDLEGARTEFEKGLQAETREQGQKQFGLGIARVCIALEGILYGTMYSSMERIAPIKAPGNWLASRLPGGPALEGEK